MAILANSQIANVASIAGGGTVIHGVAAFNALDTTLELSTSRLSVVRSALFTPLIADSTVTTHVEVDVAADRTATIALPKVRGVITSVTVKSSVDVDASDTNYWSIGLENASNNNAVIVNKATAANTSKASGGSAYVANTAKALTLTSTVADATVAEDAQLTLTIDATGNATKMPVFTVVITVTGQSAGVEVVDQITSATLNGTSTLMFRAPVSGIVTSLNVAVQTSITADDTNYWTVTAVNKGANGAGSAAILATSDANTTKATGGAGLTAFLDRSFTLTSTVADKTVVAGQIIAITLTKTASAGDLVLPVISVGITPVAQGIADGEDIYVSEPYDSQGFIDTGSSRQITVNRRKAVNTNLRFAYWLEGR